MQPNTMDCDTPEALRFFASACDRPVEGEWMRKAADEIERLRDERRWIPVSERLPEEDDYVLACHEGGFVRIAKLTPEEDDMLQCWRLDGGNDVTIKAFTHWMPLPEPPEVK